MADITCAINLKTSDFGFFGRRYTLFVWKFILMKMTLHSMAFSTMKHTLFRPKNSVAKLAGPAQPLSYQEEEEAQRSCDRASPT